MPHAATSIPSAADGHRPAAASSTANRIDDSAIAHQKAAATGATYGPTMPAAVGLP